MQLRFRMGARAFDRVASAKAVSQTPRRGWTGVGFMTERFGHLDIAGRSPEPYIRALRPHQWLKNVLVFLPMLAAHQLDKPTSISSLLAFISFSLVASAVYVVNDLVDLSADRAHPRKRNRPFASGSIPVAHGVWMALGLVLLGGCLAALVNLEFPMVVAGYFILSTAYSIYFKKQIIIDICVLAGLYTIRIVAGSVAASVPMSEWLLAFSAFFFLSLAAVKRQAELVDSASREKLGASGRGYKTDDLPIVSMVAIGAGYVSVLVLALYVNSPIVVSLYAHPKALWGVCAVLLYWLTRSIMIAHRGQMHDDPVVYAAKDPVSQLCLLFVLGFVALGVLH
jgi:4-hydroxybenzoate polyprenyltransferase